MKRRFNATKIGKILTNPIVKSGLSMLPFGLGSLASNFLDSNATPTGEIDPKTMPVKIMKVVIYAVLLYLVISGKIDFSQATEYKEFIGQ